jgi:hypothetical protein
MERGAPVSRARSADYTLAGRGLRVEGSSERGFWSCSTTQGGQDYQCFLVCMPWRPARAGRVPSRTRRRFELGWIRRTRRGAKRRDGSGAVAVQQRRHVGEKISVRRQFEIETRFCFNPAFGTSIALGLELPAAGLVRPLLPVLKPDKAARQTLPNQGKSQQSGSDLPDTGRTQ